MKKPEISFTLDGVDYNEDTIPEDSYKDIVSLGELNKKMNEVLAELHYLEAAEDQLLERVREKIKGAE